MVIRALQEINIDVARTMHDMGDVQMAARRIFVGIAQKDHIVAEPGAAIIAAQLRPCPPHETGKLGDVLAVMRVVAALPSRSIRYGDVTPALTLRSETK
jgi:hypothetical protein